MSKQANTIHETIADIAYIAGTHGYYSGNSRADMQEFIFLARKFEKEFDRVDWDKSDKDYIIEVENFTKENLRLVKKLDFTPNAATTPWDNIEIAPVIDEDGECSRLTEYDEQTEDFWTVYLHQIEGGVEAIADLPSKEHAEAIKQLLQNAVKSFQQNAKFLHDIPTPNRDSIVMAVLYLRNYANTFMITQNGYKAVNDVADELDALLKGEEPINADPVI